MDGVGGVNGGAPSAPASGPQQTQAGSQQAGTNAQDQAAFDAAVEELVAGELLTDFFVVEQPMIDEIMKESSK